MSDNVLETPSILLVDDDALTLELFKEILESQFTVQTATSVCEAQEKIAKGEIAVVVSDYHLGMQNADTLLAWILQTQPDLASCFILLTGDKLIDLSAFELAATVLFKPVHIETLLEQVQQTCPSQTFTYKKEAGYDTMEA